MAIHLLIDTSIWLDLVKDYRQQPVISALEDLIASKEIKLIVPAVVLEEFERNKDHVARDAKRSLQSHFTMVRDAINRFGPEATKESAIKGLNEADHAAVMKGEAVTASIERVEILLRSSKPIQASDAIKVRAAERALAKRAPFHRSKNSMADATIIEIYADAAGKKARGQRYAFVTSNTGDFSQEIGDQRVPHADFAPMFQPPRSTYWIDLRALINSFDEYLLPDLDLEFQGFDQHRTLSEILDAEQKLFKQVWYNRHLNRRVEIEGGKLHVVSKENYSTKPYRQDQVLDTVWEGALKSAKRTEEELGPGNIGPWTNFEWGMINGKLSALRWILGDDWDNLDT